MDGPIPSLPAPPRVQALARSMSGYLRSQGLAVQPGTVGYANDAQGIGAADGNWQGFRDVNGGQAAVIGPQRRHALEQLARLYGRPRPVLGQDVVDAGQVLMHELLHGPAGQSTDPQVRSWEEAAAESNARDLMAPYLTRVFRTPLTGQGSQFTAAAGYRGTYQQDVDRFRALSAAATGQAADSPVARRWRYGFQAAPLDRRQQLVQQAQAAYRGQR